MSSLGRLISEIAHEVNNPLQAISGNAQLSLTEGMKKEEIIECLRVIETQCYRARDIIRRLLNFSRPGKGKTEKVILQHMVEETIKLLEHQYQLGGVDITRSYQEKPITVIIDPSLFQEVLFNVIKNAFESITGTGEISISVSALDSRAKITVKDTGCGMNEDVMKHLFAPFFTTKDEGTGLGLSVCYGIIKEYGGDIRYVSTPGAGTEAVIFLKQEG